MSYIVIVGFEGRMAQSVQKLLTAAGREYRVFSPKAPKQLRTETFKDSLGVIDFSTPEVSRSVLSQALKDSAPLVCGTTGFGSEEERNKMFQPARDKIPIVLDSNFSIGIELLCQASEKLALHLNEAFFITDIHHQHKKDAPSGTSLKLEARIRKVKPILEVEHRSLRMGEIAGEHSVSVAFGQERLQLTHQAFSKDVFSQGAIRALDWLQSKEPGVYSMKEVLS